MRLALSSFYTVLRATVKSHWINLQAKIIEIEPGLQAKPAANADAAALADLVEQNLAHICRYLPAVAALASIRGAQAHIERITDLAAKEELLEWVLLLDGELCGSIRLNQIDKESRKAGLGYFIGAQFQGRGIMTKAVGAACAFCFDTLDLNRIELRCASTNLASMRVAERLGFTREGVLRQAELLGDAFVDLYVYGLLREEYMLLGHKPQSQ